MAEIVRLSPKKRQTLLFSATFSDQVWGAGADQRIICSFAQTGEPAIDPFGWHAWYPSKLAFDWRSSRVLLLGMTSRQFNMSRPSTTPITNDYQPPKP